MCASVKETRGVRVNPLTPCLFLPAEHRAAPDGTSRAVQRDSRRGRAVKALPGRLQHTCSLRAVLMAVLGQHVRGAVRRRRFGVRYRPRIAGEIPVLCLRIGRASSAVTKRGYCRRISICLCTVVVPR
jgi:hypothetical protein